MPNKNGTGPEGKGPRTGRGMGPCGDEKSDARRPGRGDGRGRGLRFARSSSESGEDK